MCRVDKMRHLVESQPWNLQSEAFTIAVALLGK